MTAFHPLNAPDKVMTTLHISFLRLLHSARTAASLPAYGHNVNLAWIPFIPQGWKNLQFLEPKRKVESVGVVINIVSTHLDGLYLHERISYLSGSFCCLFKEFSANALSVIFPQHTHDCQFNSMPAGFFQIEESKISSYKSGHKEFPRPLYGSCLILIPFSRK